AREAFDELVRAGARLTGAVREAEAARLGADQASDARDVGRLAARAVPAAEPALRAAAVVDAAVAAVHDALARAHEGRARRAATDRQVRDAVQRVQRVLADAERRLASRRPSVAGATEAASFARADELLAEAQLGAGELDELGRRFAAGAVRGEEVARR